MSAFWLKYGTGTGQKIRIPMVVRAAVDHATGSDWTPASGDVKISKDGGAPANIATLPTFTNGRWEFVFSDAELQCKQGDVTIIDSATKVVEDSGFNFETYGHASAMYQADLSAANLPANMIQLGSSTQSATDLKDFADTGYDPVAHKVAEVAVLTGHTVQTGDSYPIVNSGTHGNAALKSLIDAVDNFVDTEIADLQTQIGVAGAGLTDIPKTGYKLAADGLPTMPTDWITAAGLSVGAVAEMQSGLSTLDAAGVRAAVGLASANLDTQIDALPTAAEIRVEIDGNSTQLAAILGDTNELQVDWADGGRLDLILDARASQSSLDALQGDVTGLESDIAAILIDTGTTLPAQIAGLLTTAGAEGYRTDGATGSVFELLYELVALNGEFAISGTTKQHYKLNGTTPAFASTLNDATNPTAITRA